MASTSLEFADALDGLGIWRAGLRDGMDRMARLLAAQDLLDATTAERLAALRDRLANDKLVVAFVAEFSRGKSELINAIFFADTGRRILPATPGRTTMCPVELAYDPAEPPSLKLLPISTRLQGGSLADLRGRADAWHAQPLDVADPERLADALCEVMRTRSVPIEEARALGFWNDDTPDDNPPLTDGRVDVPLWRHALINYPHPLLQRGLVVLDTPGLNALGAEPELTLGLLPSAHATVFILGADTGVTRSDAAIWRDHLSGDALARFVVLNKIDTLADPLLSTAEIQGHIERQCRDTAAALGVPIGRVFPISARQGLAARVADDAEELALSRVPELESALAAQLLPQRRDVLQRMVVDGLQQTETHLMRRLLDRRRQGAEQTLELRGLRGKSQAKLRTMLQRVDAEVAEFDRGTARLQAMRAVHARMLDNALSILATDGLRALVGEVHGGLLGLGARSAFERLCERLRGQLRASQGQVREIHDMLSASYATLNADFGFSLALAPTLDLKEHFLALDTVERNYAQYLGLKQALRLAQPKFLEQFRRMMTSRLRVVFEMAGSAIEAWNREASNQIESQLRERRRAFKRRREALERIQSAAGELESRIRELEVQEKHLLQLEAHVTEHLQALRREARHAADVGDVPDAANAPQFARA